MRFRDTNDLPELDPGAPPDVRDEPWHQFADEIRALRASPEYIWADEQLARIAATVDMTHRVTDQQRHTIEKIRTSEWTPSRRYDSAGYRRRWR